MENWEICKEIGFDYGHRVWSQKLNQEYSIDNRTVCRHLHGHRGKVFIHLTANTLESGMVSDFKHLNWAKNFVDDYVDHKFILDISDPWANNIINGNITKNDNGDVISVITNSGTTLPVAQVYVPKTSHFAGYVIKTDNLEEGPEQEFYEGFFLVDFLPTSENLSKWLWEIIDSKMSLIDVRTSKIEWWETPKSCSTYTG